MRINMEIGLFKFTYGEEMIAEYEDRGEHFYVQNTGTLIPNENMSWNLVTWMPYTNIKNGFLIPKEMVWFVTPICEDMISYYENWKQSAKKLYEDEQKSNKKTL